MLALIQISWPIPPYPPPRLVRAINAWVGCLCHYINVEIGALDYYDKQFRDLTYPSPVIPVTRHPPPPPAISVLVYLAESTHTHNLSMAISLKTLV